MAAARRVRVRLTADPTCFVALPAAMVQALFPSAEVKATVFAVRVKRVGDASARGDDGAPPHVMHLSWGGGACANDVLEVPRVLAECLQLSEGDDVTVQPVRAVLARQVFVSPASVDDWEILELNARVVEEQLLNQVNVLSAGQTFPFAVGRQVAIRLDVERVVPGDSPFVCLTRDSEIAVRPRPRFSGAAGTSCGGGSAVRRDTPSVALRVLYTRVGARTAWPRGVTVHTRVLHRMGWQRGQWLEVRHGVPGTWRARVFADDGVPHDHVAVPRSTRDALGVRAFSTVQLAAAHEAPDSGVVRRICLHRVGDDAGAVGERPTPEEEGAIKTAFARYTRAQRAALGVAKLPLFQGECVHVPGIGAVAVGVEGTPSRSGGGVGSRAVQEALRGGDASEAEEGEPERFPLGLFLLEDGCTLDVGARTRACESVDGEHRGPLVHELGGFDGVAGEVMQWLAPLRADNAPVCRAMHYPQVGGVVLHGSHGSGKSVLLRALGEAMRLDAAQLIHTRVIVAAELVHREMSAVKRVLREAVDEAIAHAPAAILIDDLDTLLPVPRENTDARRTITLSEWMVEMFARLRPHARCCVVATCKSLNVLNSIVLQPALFGHAVELRAPDRAMRVRMLARMVEMAHVRVADGSVLSLAAQKTDGYLASDLSHVVHRAVHAATARTIARCDTNSAARRVLNSRVSTLTAADVEQALDGFTPVCLKGVKVLASDVTWSDVGGLEETCEALKDALEIPTKYAALFHGCPVPQKNGLLLFGPPGCGKTLLASAVAGECDLNFVSVNGPELLNKYIGASEQAVRDVFARAAAAAPSVLFFDEIDAIAPRRGHDSAGVSDRVVNQLLTELDGVEGREGVFVLGATSRPDLIDPALLRPGRLDKTLYCGYPTAHDRASILRAAARKLHVAEDIVYEEIARKTPGYTGADLQALVYNAHLLAVHDTLDEHVSSASPSKSKSKGKGKGKATPRSSKVRRRNRALNTSSPSTPVRAGASRVDYHVVALSGKVKSRSQQEESALKERVAAIHENVSGGGRRARSSGKDDRDDPAEDLPLISAIHMLRAVEQTPCSLSEVERKRLERRYEQFMSDRGMAFADAQRERETHGGVGKRVTLA